MHPEIRVAGPEEMGLLEAWAVREGWGAGVGDASAFHATDPEGFLLAVDREQVIGSISAVRYSGEYHFIGYYIVEPALRRRGVGHALFAAALDRVGGGVAGLDAVAAQVGTYRGLGFEPAHVTTRHVGDRRSAAAAMSHLDAGRSAEPVSVEDLDAVAAYDGRHVPSSRPSFVRAWLDPASPRRSFVVRRGTAIGGLATVRPSVGGGARVGPLFADDDGAALTLLARCLEEATGWGDAIAIEVPETNAGAVSLVRSLGLEPSFSCTRMYRGGARAVPTAEIWGATTFELG